ncbi:hypothetical protein RDI58_019989 [Solanum bulbocastanum]|uniref:Uncharacterized protein n=1 Tax=Solanum bulbocastanum TaxID=147425 RepID=A0AAN8T5L0_SOLBU
MSCQSLICRSFQDWKIVFFKIEGLSLRFSIFFQLLLLICWWDRVESLVVSKFAVPKETRAYTCIGPGGSKCCSSLELASSL